MARPLRVLPQMDIPHWDHYFGVWNRAKHIATALEIKRDVDIRKGLFTVYSLTSDFTSAKLRSTVIIRTHDVSLSFGHQTINSLVAPTCMPNLN